MQTCIRLNRSFVTYKHKTGESLSLKARPISDCRLAYCSCVGNFIQISTINSHKVPLLVCVKYCYLSKSPNPRMHHCGSSPLWTCSRRLASFIGKLWKSCECSFGRNINLLRYCRVSWPLYSCDCLPSFRNRSL